MTKDNCIISGCPKEQYVREWCNAHYQAGKKNGSIQPLTREQRIWSKVEKADPCWPWRGQVDKGSGGYGRYHGERAHRLIYEMTVGPIPDGLLVDHRCQNRICVNPEHLRLATQKQNGENLVQRHKYVRGVYWHTQSQRWRVCVTHHRKRYHGGSFSTIEAAEQAAIALRNELFTHNDLDRQE